MKKLVVVSDNHGNQKVLKTVKQIVPDADYYIHCGNSEADIKEELDGYICVKGNRGNLHLDIPREYKKIKRRFCIYLLFDLSY